MKLVIDDFEIEVSARRLTESRKNKEATMYFLNTLSLFAAKAQERFYDVGAVALSEWAKECSDDIYYFLKDNGAYEKK